MILVNPQFQASPHQQVPSPLSPSAPPPPTFITSNLLPLATHDRLVIMSCQFIEISFFIFMFYGHKEQGTFMYFDSFGILMLFLSQLVPEAGLLQLWLINSTVSTRVHDWACNNLLFIIIFMLIAFVIPIVCESYES